MATTILLVEPHDEINFAFRRAISQTKYEIAIETRTGEEAIQRFKTVRPRPALVVMDIVFPGMGGIRTMEEIHKIDPLTRVVFLHDQKSAYRAVEAMKKGAKDTIRFPFRSREKVLELLEVAQEDSRGVAALGADEHFAHLRRPLALTLRKKGIFSFLSPKHTGLSEQLSVNQILLISDKRFAEGDLLDIEVRFPSTTEKVTGRVRTVRKLLNDFEMAVECSGIDKAQRERLRHQILAFRAGPETAAVPHKVATS